MSITAVRARCLSSNRQRRCRESVLVLCLTVAATSCGSGWTGEYRAEVRVAPAAAGKSEVAEAGYTLAEVQARLAQEPRTLTLKRDGRYVMGFGDRSNEGAWRVEGNALILRDDISNGTPIVEALRLDRRLRLGDNGEIIDEGTYGRYNLELVYVRR